MDDSIRLIEEKYKNLEEKLAQERADKEKLFNKFDKLEDKVSTVERHMGSNLNDVNLRFSQLDVQFKEFAKTTTDKLDNYNNEVKESNKEIKNQISDLIKMMNTPKKEAFKDWVYSFGIKVLEIAIIAGLAIAFAKNIKL